jgi:hypothetical protein
LKAAEPSFDRDIRELVGCGRYQNHEASPMNREVNVTKRVQTAAGLRYCPVVLSANGRIKPDAVMVNGK